MKIVMPPQNYVLSRQPVKRSPLPHFKQDSINYGHFYKKLNNVAKYDPGEANKGFFTANAMLYNTLCSISNFPSLLNNQLLIKIERHDGLELQN